MAKDKLEKAYLALTSDDDGRLCRDIPESACDEQPRHFFFHLASLALNKLADGLSDPKLILSWLITQLGASNFFIGLLVPIREAGALLPQLFHSEWVRQQAQRKWVWSAGAIAQGISVLLMVLAVIFLSANAATVTILLALGLLAVARSFCSVSYKDVLGKTIGKSQRGTVTGTANSVAAAGVFVFAIAISLGWINLDIEALLMVLTCAGLAWIIAGIIFAFLTEKKGSTDGGAAAKNGLVARLKTTLKDSQLVRFILTRSLLTATAFAPPFIVLLAQQSSNTDALLNLEFDTSQIGILLLASALASLLSSYIWGRLADKSSRKVLIAAALVATCGFATITLLNMFSPSTLGQTLIIAGLLFITLLAHQGVRLGRSTHLVDMANEDSRANYTAVGNTITGIVLLAGSIFGWLLHVGGISLVFSIFTIMTLCAAVFAFSLKEVQQ